MYCKVKGGHISATCGISEGCRQKRQEGAEGMTSKGQKRRGRGGREIAYIYNM